ncbi:MAG: cysteine hydrolase family protein, partial [Caulobacteraceae bacterium]
PQAGDLVIRKRLYGAFFETALDAELRAEGIDTLVLAGLTTECCVEATAREAFHRGYHVFIVADACASNDSAAHQASLGAMSRLCAIVVDAGAVERAWGDS